MKKISHYQFFFLRIFLPAFLAIFLFVFFIMQILLPSLEKSFLNNKKEMLKELTNTAISILNKSWLDAKNEKLTTEQAQKMALEKIQALHYGIENKDYFWITDFEPKMIMHPYRKDLIGKNVADFKDLKGKKIFTELRDLALAQREGYLEYYWQWMDHAEQIEPKLSYIKVFEPWNWIIGTGIYLTDMKKEIDALKSDFLRITLIIFIFITFLMIIIVFFSFKTEKYRRKAELELIESEKKYRLLVENTSDGFILLLKDRPPFYNHTIREMLGYERDENNNLLKDSIFSEDLKPIQIDFEYIDSEYEKNIQFEAKLKKKNGAFIDVLIHISPIEMSEHNGIILIIKDITNQKAIERKKTEREEIFVELQSSLLFLNRPIDYFIKSFEYCLETDSIYSVASLMKEKNLYAILVADQNKNFTGIITERDFKNKIAEIKNWDTQQPVSSLMNRSFPVLSLNSSVFEAMLKIQDSEAKSLVVVDEEEKIVGLLNENDLFEIQANSYAKIIQEIKASNSIAEIKEIKKKMLPVIHTLIESGANPKNICLFLTRLSDTVTRKIIDFAFQKLGQPPLHFSFMALGSEGREEETLLTDQDNILIYDDCEESIRQKAADYFLNLGNFICDGLNECGYSYCKGNIMAKNPSFNQPISVWKKYFKKWIMTPHPQALLDINIFFDFRTIYSTFQEEKFHKKDLFFSHLREYIHQLLSEKNDFFIFMAKNALHYTAPIGFLGNIVLSEKEGIKDVISIKESLVLLVNFARIYSLKHHITDSNTLNRLRILYERKIITSEVYQEITHVYNYLMQMRLKNQAKLLEENKTPHNYLEVKKLTGIEYAILKKMLNKMRIFQVRLNNDFLGGGGMI